MLLKLFNFIAKQVSYTFAVALYSIFGMWLVIPFGYYFIISNVEFLPHQEKLLVFILLVGLLFATLFHYIYYGLLHSFRFSGFTKSIKLINKTFSQIDNIEQISNEDLSAFLTALTHLPQNNLYTAVSYSGSVAVIFAFLTYFLSNDVYYFTIGFIGGIIFVVIYGYFTFITTEYVTGPTLVKIKKFLYDNGISFENKYTSTLRTKTYFLILLILTSMIILTIFLKSGEQSITKITFFIFITLIANGILVFLWLNSIVTSLEQINEVTKDLVSGESGGILFPIFSSKEFVEFSSNFNSAVSEVVEIRANLEERVIGRTLELMNAKEDLEKQNIELNIQKEKLQIAYEELKVIEKLKSDFVSSVSHELRTPLTSILGFAKIILKNYKKIIPSLSDRITDTKINKYIPRIEEGLDIIIKEGERLTRLINDVLDLAKIESGRMEWNNQLLNANEIIQEAINTIKGFFIDKQDVEFINEIEDNLGDLYVDKDRIIQVINNFISNSIKFTECGYIKLKAFQKGESIQIEIEDTGIGIREEDKSKVFERFRQVGDTLTSKPKGTGLGLSICKEIIEHYGGRVWLESELGKGSAFKFLLPTKD